MFVNTNAAISVRHLDFNLPDPPYYQASWNDTEVEGGQLKGIIFFNKSALYPFS